MSPATILRIHSIISSALDLAVRYDWADPNVAKNARPPHPRKREPDPPTPDRAARLANLVWAEDEELGLYLWTALTTGAGRGEVSALRENRFDFTRQQVRVASNYLVKQGQHIEKAPKDGEGRVPSLDLLTCDLFQERFGCRRAEARHRRRSPRRRVRVLPGSGRPRAMEPDTMTHRYRRYAPGGHHQLT
jgi:integrase